MNSVGKNHDIGRELKKAKEIQKLLLPQHIPEINGADIAFQFEPVHELSGDFLDFYYKKSDDQLGFFICDVSGHGVPAALLAAMVKMSLQLWGEHISEPVGTLKKIHRSLNGMMGEHFLTAIMGYICLKTGALLLARAGHPPAMILKPDGDIQKIEPDGGIIHEQVDPFFEEYKGKLEKDDTLIMFTDGLIEAPSKDGKMLDYDGFEKIIKENRRENVKEMGEKILKETFNFAGGKEKINDDLSLFIIKYHGANIKG
ncbi:MAG: PP2C family protein-serine/threonine phosphatase [Spirochaetia bacterium]|nr:PP2C family protein-serine/threonine phosphatase [Spirochaetia bacterium]